MTESSVRDLWDYGLRLSRDPVRTTARVTDAEAHPPNGPKAHEWTYVVRYRFRVPGDDRTYRATDRSFFGHDDDTTVSVSKRLYGRALRTHEVRVEYLESDPSINQPVDAPRGSWTMLLLAVVSVGILAFGVLLVRLGLDPLWHPRDASLGRPWKRTRG
jgi:hypothetical protein